MRLHILAWGLLVLAIAAWCGFCLMVWKLNGDRIAHASATSEFAEQSLRGEAVARLRAVIQGTEVERAAIESVVGVSILDAVETIETAGKQAGAADVSIGEATPSAKSPQGISSVSIVANATGSFSALMRTVMLFETLPIPATIEQFEIAKTEKTWRLTARLRVILAEKK